MMAAETFLYILRRTGLVLGALFLMTVLLAAMPGHRAPVVSTQGSQEISSAPSRDLADMPRTDAKRNEKSRAKHAQQMTDIRRQQLEMTPTR